MRTDAQSTIGANKTGIMVSPKEAAKTAEGAVDLTQPVTAGDQSAFAENRIRYMKEADPVGTLPMPGTVRGAISSLQEKVMNGNHAFMDKLGERIAFERTGSRLYEALISKYNGTANAEALPPLEVIQRFYREERNHFNIAARVMTQIGGDPTAVTPAADVCGVAAMGWVQVISDPRTTFLQSLEIILQAELVDNACWELMIELAKSTGLKSIADEFKTCLTEEAEHLATVKKWVSELTLKNKTLTDQVSIQ